MNIQSKILIFEKKGSIENLDLIQLICLINFLKTGKKFISFKPTKTENLLANLFNLNQIEKQKKSNLQR